MCIYIMYQLFAIVPMLCIFFPTYLGDLSTPERPIVSPCSWRELPSVRLGMGGG